MTKSELIVSLAGSYPQLLAKDAELTVKTILDAMSDALANGQRIEIRGFGRFRTQRSPSTGRPQSTLRRKSDGRGKTRPSLQAGQGIASASRCSGKPELIFSLIKSFTASKKGIFGCPFSRTIMSCRRDRRRFIFTREKD